METFLVYLLLEREAMLKTIEKAKLAAQDNIKAFHYKNEQALYEVFLECEEWTKDKS
jgi:hypothetical protein